MKKLVWIRKLGPSKSHFSQNIYAIQHERSSYKDQFGGDIRQSKEHTLDRLMENRTWSTCSWYTEHEDFEELLRYHDLEDL